MPKVYTRKYQAELEDLLYFLLEYPELGRYLTLAQRNKIEESRQQLKTGEEIVFPYRSYAMK